MSPALDANFACMAIARSVSKSAMSKTTGGRAVREFRQRSGKSLEWLAEQIERHCGDRPSTAKLSRIETGQDIPIGLLPTLERITSIPAARLRPDLARLFGVKLCA